MMHTAQQAPAPSSQPTQETSAGNSVGKTRLLPETLPAPTYWPAVLALGVVLMCWGVVTTVWLSGVGLLLFGVALTGWIGDLRHEC